MDLAVGSVMFWVVGYSIMYGGETILGGFMRDPSDLAFFSEDDWHNLFFQTVFCATAATIVSGAVAGRFKFSSYLIISAVLTTFIYPVSGSWLWPFDDQAWLNNLGFIDFAGSTIVHAVGGFAALVAAKLVGPRIGKYGPDGKVNAIPGHNLVLGALGVFILWLGWFGFNGGSQLAFGGDDSIAVGSVIINTNLAAALGGIAALFFTWIKYGKPDISMTLNGALTGLVGITAEPLTPSPLAAIFIGAIAGVLMYFSTKLLFKMKIDDVVGAIPAHLVAGVWGTLAVPLTNGDVTFGAQFLGTISVVVFVFIVSFIVFQIIKNTIGLRISKEAERLGTDKAEVGVIAYGIRD